MTDLSRLFQTPLASHLPSRSRNARPAASSLRSKGPAPWSIDKVEADLKKNIRETMDESSLSTQLGLFQSQQKKEAISVLFLFSTVAYLACLALDLDERVTFHLFLLFAVHFLPSLAFRLTQEAVVHKSLVCVRPIIYLATCYYLLKVLAGANISQLNLPLTLAAVATTAARSTLEYFDAIYLIQVSHLSRLQLKERTFFKRLALCPLFYWQRASFIATMREQLLVAVLVSFSLGITVCLCLCWEVLATFSLINLLCSLAAFTMLQCILEFIRLLPRLFPSQLSGVRDKTPVVLTLLRLSPMDGFSQELHRRCLQSLLLRMQRTPCFLSNQTCKSLIFAKYMDVLAFHATRELQELLRQVSSLLLQAERNQRAFQSQKTMIEDIFAPLSRWSALISQTSQLKQILGSLNKTEPLLNVLFLADQQAFTLKDDSKVPPRVVELLELLSGKLGQGQRCVIGKGVQSRELQGWERELSGRLFSVRQGWVGSSDL